MRKIKIKIEENFGCTYVLSSHVAHEWVTGLHDGDESFYQASVKNGRSARVQLTCELCTFSLFFVI